MFVSGSKVDRVRFLASSDAFESSHAGQGRFFLKKRAARFRFGYPFDLFRVPVPVPSVRRFPFPIGYLIATPFSRTSHLSNRECLGDRFGASQASVFGWQLSLANYNARLVVSRHSG